MVVGRRPAAASVYTTWSLSVRGLYRCVHSQKGLISCLKDDRRSVVNPSVVAGSERRSTARQIVSKFIEFVCPSSARRRSTGSERRSTAKQIVSKLLNRIRLSVVNQSVVNPSVVAVSERRPDRLFQNN
jgi:hypothetical protein